MTHPEQEPLNPVDDEDLLVALLFPVTTQAAREDALQAVAPEDFWSPHHAAVWKSAKALADSGQRITARAVRASEPSQAVRWLLDRVTSTMPPVSDYPRAVAEVIRCGRLRRLVEATDRIRQRVLAAEDVAQALTIAHDELARLDATTERGDVQRLDQLLDAFHADLASVGTSRRVPTPWQEVNDEIAGGVHGGRMYVIGARPGDGKSLAAHNVAAHAAELGHEALIFSVEMGSLEVTARLVAAGAKVELKELVRREVSDYAHARIVEYSRRARQLPLSVVDKADITMPYVRSVCRNHKRRHGLSVVVVDYLQLVTGDSTIRSREQQVAQISRQLKLLSRELDVAVVVPAQLNRESTRRSGRPVMADLRESGAIEADADVVMLLAREVFPAQHQYAGEFNGQLAVYVDKNRHGRQCHLSLPWRAHYATIG